MKALNLNEEAFFFQSSSNFTLHGFLHKPTTAIQPKLGIIYCHPFAEEKNISHGVAVRTSRALARQGIPVLRFDMSGCGDSSGNLEETTIGDWLNDIATTVRILKEKTSVEHYALWGIRLGAGLTLHHFAQFNEAKFLILWQPVVDFNKHIKDFLRRKIIAQITAGSNQAHLFSNLIKEIDENGIIEINGYLLSKKLYKSFNNIGTKPFHVFPRCPTLLLSVSHIDQPPLTIRKHYNNLLLGGTPVQLIHVNQESFWDRYWQWECQEATDITIKWIRKLLNN